MSEDNKTGVLKACIERIVELETEKKKVSDDRREIVQGLNEQGEPAKLLIALSKSTPLDEEQTAAHQRAGAITGKPIYVTATSVTLDELGIAEVDAEAVMEEIANIHAADESKDGFKGAIKELYTELKDLGFATRVVKEIVHRRLHPKKAGKQVKFQELLDIYEKAIAA